MRMVEAGWKPDVSVLERDPRVPRPTGYKVALLVPPVQEKTAGGIIMTDTAKDRERLGSMIGYVLALGPDAYQDHRKFPTGPWCKPGDWVITPPYPPISLDLTLEGKDGSEYRVVFLNDEAIAGTVGDPSALRRR